MFHFLNPDHLELRDIICLALSMVLVITYHIFLFLHSYFFPHRSLSSHMDYQRVWWVRQVYDDVREKIATIQNFRSFLMILVFYAEVTLGGAAVGVELALNLPQGNARARGFFPAVLFVAAFVNLIFSGIALHYLHFHCMLETISAEGQDNLHASATVNSAGAASSLAASRRAVAVEEGLMVGSFGAPQVGETSASFGSTSTAPPPPPPIFGEAHMRTSKLYIASMVGQLKVHFRLAQRLMLVASVALLWNVEPVVMLAGQILLLVNFYYCDFCFPASVNRLFVLGRRHRGVPFDRSLDRVKGVMRSKHKLRAGGGETHFGSLSGSRPRPPGGYPGSPIVVFPHRNVSSISASGNPSFVAGGGGAPSPRHQWSRITTYTASDGEASPMMPVVAFPRGSSSGAETSTGAGGGEISTGGGGMQIIQATEPVYNPSSPQPHLTSPSAISISFQGGVLSPVGEPLPAQPLSPSVLQLQQLQDETLLYIAQPAEQPAGDGGAGSPLTLRRARLVQTNDGGLVAMVEQPPPSRSPSEEEGEGADMSDTGEENFMAMQ